MIVYKIFRLKNNKVYPLYVLANEALKIGVTLKAKEAEKTTNNKVKSKLGELAYRPGWHSSNKPFFKHIKTAYNADGSLKKGFCICECTVEGKDCTEKAQKQGKIWYKKCFTNLKDFNGFYKFKTNTSASVNQIWIISDNIKINKIIKQGK